MLAYYPESKASMGYISSIELFKHYKMKKSIIKAIVVRGSLVAMLMLPLSLKSQETIQHETSKLNDFLTPNPDKLFTPYFALQSWGTYGFNGSKKDGEPLADRGDVLFRRFRFGGNGTPFWWLKYSFQLSLDGLGQDKNSIIKGSYGGVRIWSAYLTAKLLKSSDLLNIHAGYYWAAISREYNTSFWAVGSLDKAYATWYLRSFVAGTGNGIENGVSFGGLKNFDNFGIIYRIGTFEPARYESSKYGSRLYTARVMLSFGDPEQKSYAHQLSGNQWGKRNGITLGFGASTQSNGKLTDELYFNRSIAYGADLLIDYKGWRFDGEYFKFNRKADRMEEFEGNEWHVRASYTFGLLTSYIEPIVSFDKYQGVGNRSLFQHIGYDQTLDLGVNWYVNKDIMKLGLHYLKQKGSAASKRGDMIGVTCQIRFSPNVAKKAL